ncbi:MAG TPA: nucleoside 2-deoxyribosyltransferase domain-containing protein [Kofleriaceae bacterium]|nr:nucleoside 2-deoxyribosyltransferase domain-containing protein [Kofleriaceae bacterium]
MRELCAPHPLPADLSRSVFLAGTIDMGTAAPWQAAFIRELADLDGVILNPRRPDWDASWTRTDPRFREQVDWELTALERASLIAMWFEPGSRSPITLLELGLHVRSGKLLVGCPTGFSRAGNVEITCARYGAPVYDSWSTFVTAVRSYSSVWKQPTASSAGSSLEPSTR